MKKDLVALVVLASSVALPVVGCGGSPAVTCQTAMCSSGSKSYQVCSHTDGTVSYDFGGMSCSCASSNTAACQTCSTEVAGYCTGGGGGTGGTGGGGGGGAACGATFTGGVTGTYSGCTATITYVSSSDTWTLGLPGGALGGAAYTWNGFQLSVAGMPAAASYGAANAKTIASSLSPASGSSPYWTVSISNGNAPIGSATVDVTSIGTPGTQVSGATLYSNPHGHFAATMHDVVGGNPADVTVAADF